MNDAAVDAIFEPDFSNGGFARSVTGKRKASALTSLAAEPASGGASPMKGKRLLEQRLQPALIQNPYTNGLRGGVGALQ